jgi:uncharacterized membrane protein
MVSRLLVRPFFNHSEIAMQTRNRLTLFVLSVTFGLANAASAYPEYRVTVVGPANSQPLDINQAGVVVGNYPVNPNTTHGFLNRGKGLVDLGALGGKSSDARAINDKGVVLGNWTTAGGQQRGYIYYHGRQHDIGVIPGKPTTFVDINNAGYAIALAASSDPEDPIPRSFLRAPAGTYRDIGTLPFPRPLTQARALNNRNQITGESGQFQLPDPALRAFLWTRGAMRDLGDFGAVPNSGQAINDRGQVTGYAAVPTSIHNQVAFLYSHGRLIDIDRRPASAERFSQGTGINNHGHVVGFSNHLSGFVYRGRRMESLNALIDPRLGWDIRFPQAINDAGQIVAVAFRKDVQYSVRLDLIRPSLEALPAPDADDEAAAPAQTVSPADAQAEAEAQAREVARPVTQ